MSAGDEWGLTWSSHPPVSDADSGSLLGQGTYDEDGSSASGSATFTDYFAYGRTYEVVLEVSDGAGSTVSASRTVSE